MHLRKQKRDSSALFPTEKLEAMKLRFSSGSAMDHIKQDEGLETMTQGKKSATNLRAKSQYRVPKTL